ncbi:hypothetical protein CJU90_6531 [Yarrowia sp. C11]|nr:hypothetical protein CJU90_6531 [Yarrowia sp. C11]KAG5371231.1 hypothetical protein CKK34_1371 [Yarrowia sp. E02]
MNEFQEKIQRYNEYRHLYHPRPKAPQFNNLPIHHPTQGPFYYTAGDTKIDIAPVGQYFSASLVDGSSGIPRDYTWAPSGHVEPLYYCTDEALQGCHQIDVDHNQPPDYYENLPRCPDAPSNVSIPDGARMLFSQPTHTEAMRYPDALSHGRRASSAGYRSFFQNSNPTSTGQPKYPIKPVHTSNHHSWPQDTFNSPTAQKQLLNPRVKALICEYGQRESCSSVPVQSDQSLLRKANLSSGSQVPENLDDLNTHEFELLNNAINYFVRYIKRAHKVSVDPDADVSSDSSMESIYTEESTDSDSPTPSTPSTDDTGTKESIDASLPSSNTVHSVLALFDPI